MWISTERRTDRNPLAESPGTTKVTLGRSLLAAGAVVAAGVLWSWWGAVVVVAWLLASWSSPRNLLVAGEHADSINTQNATRSRSVASCLLSRASARPAGARPFVGALLSGVTRRVLRAVRTD